MNPQKSNRTLLIEQERAARMEERKRKREEKARDRAIREERRRHKAEEKQAKKEERMKRQRVRESVAKNGVPGIRPSESGLGLRDAIAVNPLMFCEGCGNVVREGEMVGDICEQCFYSIEGRVNDRKDEKLKAVNKGLPDVVQERETKPDALAGQLKLI